jgi:hypothetical protein
MSTKTVVKARLGMAGRNGKLLRKTAIVTILKPVSTNLETVPDPETEKFG